MEVIGLMLFCCNNKKKNQSGLCHSTSCLFPYSLYDLCKDTKGLSEHMQGSALICLSQETVCMASEALLPPTRLDANYG